ncbi:MAG: AbiEi antitoxin N-terminal domain-containing protein [Flavobacteriaceae bacterium]|nr:AbiEi antitoxin N-terminal domain-containing protein [Flavobacteriaceae bacterium]MCY4266714.1 AbiEi antitoxin N-terminal domain-containing protein [Flavobacteriaceae bacterium]MCY4297726.1 AbiEi antitoxin N-terminal domain-containing protein [Flavobacteriaceae bacterium]
MGNKLDQLVDSYPKGSVFLTSWLEKEGISKSLQQKYRKSKKLKSIGRGAMVMFNQTPNIFGAISALQNQSNLKVHIGSTTSLIIINKTHDVYFTIPNVDLFGDIGQKLPKWFINYDWDLEIDYRTSNMLPQSIGLIQKKHDGHKLTISCHERALLEQMYSAPNRANLEKCFLSFEMISSPNIPFIQRMLENSKSAKANRVFLLFSENILPSKLFRKLNPLRIKLGNHLITLSKPGVKEPKYNMMLPYDLVAKDFNLGRGLIKTITDIHYGERRV